MDIASCNTSLTPPEVLFDSLIIMASSLVWIKDIVTIILLIGQHT